MAVFTAFYDANVLYPRRQACAGGCYSRQCRCHRHDEFVVRLLDLAPGAVVAAAQNHRQSLKNPPKAVAEYLETLERQGLPQTASVLRKHML
ncbi:MAG: hypothetical protein WBL61_00570 [Bryobacteraceae bacterium]